MNVTIFGYQNNIILTEVMMEVLLTSGIVRTGGK